MDKVRNIHEAHRKEVFKVHLLHEESIRDSYQKRLTDYAQLVLVSSNLELSDMRNRLVKVDNKVFGKKRTNTRGRGL